MFDDGDENEACKKRKKRENREIPKFQNSKIPKFEIWNQIQTFPEFQTIYMKKKFEFSLLISKDEASMRRVLFSNVSALIRQRKKELLFYVDPERSIKVRQRFSLLASPVIIIHAHKHTHRDTSSSRIYIRESKICKYEIRINSSRSRHVWIIDSYGRYSTS